MNLAARAPAFRFDNTYARDLAGLYTAWQPAAAPSPRLLFFNRDLAAELGLDADALDGPDGAAVFAGNRMPDGAAPIAQVYAGHQFGGFSPQLGDGRALLLGEVVDRRGLRRDIAFKGSGRTPYSRNGDGKAAVGPMLREVLIGEAMHALGIPTTRALAVAATGEQVLREQLLPGAVLTRVAASHLRVGTFQWAASRGDVQRLERLLDYAIARHDPSLASDPTLPVAERAVGLLRAVAGRQASLIAQWMNAGFIHGVMNTDNMTISGETIDYGPCAFLEAYDPQAVFSSIDHGGRYAYGNQPGIAAWNLARLAEALLPLMVPDTDEKASHQAAIDQAVARVTEVIEGFDAQYEAALLRGQRAKLGLRHAPVADAAADAVDAELAQSWLTLLHAAQADHTLAWRRLADAAAGDETPLRALVGATSALDSWLAQWRARCAVEDAGPGAGTAGTAGAARARLMRGVNPFVIARNHRVEEALAAASNTGDLAPLNRLLDALRRPFDEDAAQAPFGEPAPAHVTACYRTFCGT